MVNSFFELPRSPSSTVFPVLNLCAASTRILRQLPRKMSTMAISFLAVGSCLFLFQSIYTASHSPYLQHVQATVNASSACELEIDNFDFADFVLTMASAMLTVATACLLIPFVMKRRVWDPGIALMTTVLNWDPWRCFCRLGTLSRAPEAPNAYPFLPWIDGWRLLSPTPSLDWSRCRPTTCHLFIILHIYTTLSFFHLHHVQGALATDRHDSDDECR